MRCPICEQAVLKARHDDAAAIWIRCITDGDFTIAPDVLATMSRLPLATRHRVLNVAIIDRELGTLPLVDSGAITRGCAPANADPSRRNGK